MIALYWAEFLFIGALKDYKYCIINVTECLLISSKKQLCKNNYNIRFTTIFKIFFNCFKFAKENAVLFCLTGKSNRL